MVGEDVIKEMKRHAAETECRCRTCGEVFSISALDADMVKALAAARSEIEAIGAAASIDAALSIGALVSNMLMDAWMHTLLEAGHEVGLSVKGAD